MAKCLAAQDSVVDILYLIDTVARKFGHQQAKSNQKKAVSAFVNGSDVFVSLPTGSGKSFCFWCLPDLFDKIHNKQSQESILLVVSPLIALMMDQVVSLSKHGVKAVHVSEELDEKTVEEIHDGKYQILFFSPEQLLQSSVWRDMILSPVYDQNLIGLIVDEAHCVKKWGVEFRKEFSNLGEIRSLLPERTNVMALTATATRSSRRAICNVLGMEKVVVVSMIPDRPNIEYSVKHKEESMELSFASFVEEVRQYRRLTERTIVFCRTLDNAGYLYAFFKSRLGPEFHEPIGAPDLAKYRLINLFTACTPKNVKDVIVDGFCRKGEILRIVIATVAFGMGLNCPDIRRIVHWGPPNDIEAYLQETGRAGRDNLPSTAVLYIGPHDLRSPHTEASMKTYCKNVSSCRRGLLLEDFDNKSSYYSSVPKLGCCDVCNLKCIMEE